MSIDNVLQEHQNWHAETFPNATTQACEDKLREEVLELLEKLGSCGDVKETFLEIADVFFTSAKYMHSMGYDIEYFLDLKLSVIKKREYGEELTNGDRVKLSA